MISTETVGQRFVQLISHLGISKNAFAASLEKTATVIQHLVDERNKPGFDLLCKVFEVYPNVSKDWLLQGQGPMLTTGAVAAGPVVAGPQSGTDAQETAPAKENEPERLAPVPVKETVAETRAGDASSGANSEPAPTPATEVSPTSSGAPVAPAAPADTSWQTTLYTQQMSHQLALAEMRNQHLVEQQRLMQQMLDLVQRQLSK
jgi:hypothetical protein